MAPGESAVMLKLELKSGFFLDTIRRVTGRKWICVKDPPSQHTAGYKVLGKSLWIRSYKALQPHSTACSAVLD